MFRDVNDTGVRVCIILFILLINIYHTDPFSVSIFIHISSPYFSRFHTFLLTNFFFFIPDIHFLLLHHFVLCRLPLCIRAAYERHSPWHSICKTSRPSLLCKAGWAARATSSRAHSLAYDSEPDGSREALLCLPLRCSPLRVVRWGCVTSFVMSLIVTNHLHSSRLSPQPVITPPPPSPLVTSYFFFIISFSRHLHLLHLLPQPVFKPHRLLVLLLLIPFRYLLCPTPPSDTCLTTAC